METARILVAEDERLVAMALQERLESLGYEVVGCVATGEEAVDQSGIEKPDLVVMDIRLAGKLDGIEAAALIRERFDIPCIFLTAYTDEETLERAKLTEPLGYIVKPFDARLLQVSIQVALYRHRTEGERLRIREELRRSEERFRELSRIAPVGIFRADSQGRFQYVNEKFCSLAGLLPENAMGIGWSGAVHPEDRDLVRSEWEKTISRGGPLQLELRFSRPDGTTSQVFAQSHPERSKDGTVVGHVGTLTDLTELRTTQVRLRESELRLREIARSMPAALHQVRRRSDGTVALDYISGAAEEFCGMSIEEIQSRSGELLALIHEEDVDALRRVIAQSELSLQPLEYEMRLRNIKTNEERWIREVATPVRVEDGETVWHGLATDVTRRKLAEATLREAELAQRRAETRYAAILRNSPDAIISTDSSQRIVVFNRGAIEMFGYEKQEVTGQRLDLLIPDSSVDTHREFFRAFENGTEDFRPMAERPEICGRRKNGEVFPAEAIVSKIQYEGETLLTAIVRDISDRKKLEAQYLQSQKMDALGRLAGGVAHDFNNILSIIMGQTELTKLNVPDNDPIRHELDQVLACCERAAALTRQLLIFSRQQPLTPVVVDVQSVFAGMETMLRRIVGEDIELIVEPSRRTDPVLIDPGQLEQIFLNLVVNARDAMPSGGRILIAIDRERVMERIGDLEPGPCVTIHVTDTGRGMESEVVSRIFEPFYTTKEAGRGTGLGLSTVFGIVGRANGHISAESTPGKGTDFIIRLPLAKGSPEIAEDNEDQVLVKGSETILLVEDDEHLCRLTTVFLSRSGYHVLPAKNGGEAILIAEQNHDTIDLLLSDIVMPHMDGIELADRLRKEIPELRVLLMSGYPGDNERRRHDEAPVLQKPFTAAELTRKVRRVLDYENPAGETRVHEETR